MVMFDSIIAEADERFNLDGKAGVLLSALLALMTKGNGDGLAGFLEKFNAANLNDATSSWIESGANAEISNENLESALGKETLQGFASQAGIDYDTTASATAFMLPRVIDALTPDGVLPESGDLVSRIGGLLNGVDETLPSAIGATSRTAAETFDRIGTAAIPELDAEKRDVADANVVDRFALSGDAKIDDSLNRVEVDYKDDNSPLKWLLPLILLGLLLSLGYWFCSKTPPPTTETTTNTNVNQANTTAANQ